MELATFKKHDNGVHLWASRGLETLDISVADYEMAIDVLKRFEAGEPKETILRDLESDRPALEVVNGGVA